MAWPYDARHDDAVPMQPANPETINEIQERIIDLFTDRSIVEVQAISSVSGAAYNVPCWVRNWVDPSRGWAAVALQVAGDSPLIFDIRAKQSMVLKGLYVKYFNADPSNYSDNVLNLYRPDLHMFASQTTAPVLGAAVATTPTAVPPGTWAVLSFGVLNISIAIGDRLMLVLDYPMAIGDLGASPGDAIAGIACTFQPLTADT